MTSEINGNASEKKAPLYMKIYEIILSRIETGQYPENSSLPSELDFQKEFNVSRITIRRSLKDLEDAGYISRKRGKLAKVMPLRTYSNLGEVVGFSTSLKKSGGRPSSIILQFKTEPANPLGQRISSASVRRGGLLFKTAAFKERPDYRRS